MRRTVAGSMSTKAFRIERPIEPHFQHADFRPVCVQKIDRLVRGFAARTHQHDHAFGIGAP